MGFTSVTRKLKVEREESQGRGRQTHTHKGRERKREGDRQSDRTHGETCLNATSDYDLKELNVRAELKARQPDLCQTTHFYSRRARKADGSR